MNGWIIFGIIVLLVIVIGAVLFARAIDDYFSYKRPFK